MGIVIGRQSHQVAHTADIRGLGLYLRLSWRFGASSLGAVRSDDRREVSRVSGVAVCQRYCILSRRYTTCDRQRGRHRETLGRLGNPEAKLPELSYLRPVDANRSVAAQLGTAKERSQLRRTLLPVQPDRLRDPNLASKPKDDA